MGYLKRNRAALLSSGGVSIVGRVVVALGAFALVSAALATCLVAFDPVVSHQTFSTIKAETASSFLQRFDARPATPASIGTSSIRFTRGNFQTEFDEIEGLLAGKPVGGTKPGLVRSAVSEIPFPKPRPVEAKVVTSSNAQVASADSRSVLQKLADLVPSPNLLLASLTPGDGLPAVGPNLGALGYDDTTAVYDISAKSVYMPNGVRLEAHSGLGDLMDDPVHVNKPNIGATPPNTYELKPRERSFHGVKALRMIPVGDKDTLGRSGLLVHSYLLGANGASNGCVSIKNYERFLNAYNGGAIKRLVVVPNLDEVRTNLERS
jgi:hypothetical protein